MPTKVHKKKHVASVVGKVAAKGKAAGSGKVALAKATAKYEETLHPRDAAGHWITVGGGKKRFKLGLPAQRATLANKIKASRTKATTPEKHSKLAQKVRTMRAQRAGRTDVPDTKLRGQGRSDFEAYHAKKLENATLEVRRRNYADAQERLVAKELGGKWLKDYEPADAIVPRKGGKGDHAVEVKSLIFGEKNAISVHEDALENKVDFARESKDRVFHTVVFDRRNVSEGGKHASNYSGHDIYYKRACGPYGLASMYKVKNFDELRQLIEMPDHRLPAAARGEFPKGKALAELRVKAAEVREYNRTRSKVRKAENPDVYKKKS